MIVLPLLFALIAAEPQRAPELQLNLVATPPPPERPSDRATTLGAVCVNATGDAAHAPKRLKVTLADTDRLSYTVGDMMSFSVLLENVGDVPMVLGISRDPEVAPRRQCRVVAPGVWFHVVLVAMSSDRPGATLTTGFGFYGSLDAPGTTAVLQPGERARVQLPAQIVPAVGMDPTLNANPRPLRIKASVMIERESGTTGAISENTLQIELRAPVARVPHATRPR